MMAFKDLKGEARYGEGAMAGDLAEAKVMEFMESIERPVQHFGAKHVPTERAQATTWTPKIRHAPDFLGWAKFFEVQGCWNKHVIFKVDKLECLLAWDAEMPVWYAIYIQATDEIIVCPLQTVLWACNDSRTTPITLDIGTRAEKQAYEVPLEVLLDVRVKDSMELHRLTKGKKGR
jgi:hypothetical protein